MKTFFTYLKKPWIIVIIIVVFLIAGLAYAARPKAVADTFITVKPVTVSAGVSVTGKVKSAEAVDLAFQRTGKVIQVAKDVGDTVQAGDILVALDNADLRAQVAGAEAQVSLQQAKLNALLKGTRPEALNVSQTKVTNAKSNVDVANSTLFTTLQNAYSSAEDAIHNKVDEFFISPRSDNPRLAFGQAVTTTTSVETGRVEVEYRLNDLQNLLNSGTSTKDITSLSDAVKQDLAEIKLFLDNTALEVNALSTNAYLTQTTISTWKADLAAARTEVNTSLTSILTADGELQTTEASLTLAESQLSLDAAGNISDDIAAQQAEVSAAQANVANLNAELATTYIKSPIDGIVTKQDAKVGEIVPANTPVVSVISSAKFEMEANVAESDVSKVKVGQSADVTLDAYGPDVVFQAAVVSLDPAETVVDNVPTYKTTLQFSEPDDRIKSGMTANIDIHGEIHANVLAVPERAVITHNGQKFIRVKQKDGTAQEKLIQTGLRGEDGQVEITSGLNEGDMVALNQS